MWLIQNQNAYVLAEHVCNKSSSPSIKLNGQKAFLYFSSVASLSLSGTALAIASNDGTAKIYTVSNGQLHPLVGHSDAVQCLLFDKSGDFLVTGGSDLTVKVWM